jgi:hypothetical protein
MVCSVSLGNKKAFFFSYFVVRDKPSDGLDTVDPLLTIEQRGGNCGHGREVADTEAAHEEGIGR